MDEHFNSVALGDSPPVFLFYQQLFSETIFISDFHTVILMKDHTFCRPLFAETFHFILSSKITLRNLLGPHLL